jgi:CBS domain-containing protein
MGKLLPRYGNATFSGAGSLNPLMNDPDYETIGVGTRIFLGGAQGYVIGEGTQHDPSNNLGTLMVRGDCKKMSAEYVRGATFTGYGTTLYVGIGIPIPILNQRMVEKVAVSDSEIFTDVVDYGIPRRERPKIRRVSYEELKSGSITINDRKVRVSPLSSLKTAKRIAETLKSWIESASFYLSVPAESLRRDVVFKPMRQTEGTTFVNSVAHTAVTCRETDEISVVARQIIGQAINHVVVTDAQEKLRGIVTSWDITRAIAEDKRKLNEVVTKKVVTTQLHEPLEAALRKMIQHNISALPVVDSNSKVLGIITSEDIARLPRGTDR